MEELLHQNSKLNTVYSTILLSKNENSCTVRSSFQDFAQVVRSFNYWKQSSPTASSATTSTIRAETDESSSFLPEQRGKAEGWNAIDTETASAKTPILSATWLWDQCIGSHSNSQASSHLMGDALPLAVYEICIKYMDHEAELQAALFELIGTDHMDLLHVLVQNASGIAKFIKRNDLQRLLDSKNSTTDFQGNNLHQHTQRLREEALDALNMAAIAKAEAESATIKSTITSSGSNITHSVTRASEKKLVKEAKRAAKIASAAVARANEAGITVGEKTLSSLNISSLRDEAENFQQKKGLAGMTEDSLNLMKANLLPEGSKQYYETRGLPLGTKREYGDGYEKVAIPPRIVDQSKRHARVKISDVMSNLESIAFAGTEYLNPMQSAVFESAFLSQENLLICAPTGAGKTNVAMLTIVAHFRDKGILDNRVNPSYHNSGFDQGKKVIYIAPMKALAQEVVEKFDSKLRSLRINVRELTGDMQLSKAEVASSDIIVTTPEKFDVITRKSGDGSICQTIGLVIIDEVHLLADERGAVIESIVARMHRLVEATQRQMRIVGLSATLPNYRDVAEFLRVSERGLFHFGPEHRPVPLEQTFIGVSANGRNAQERKMNEICYDIVSDSLRRGHQVMVFVHSRKGTGETATALAEIAAKKGELESLFLTAGTESHGSAHTRYSDRAAKSRNRELSLHFGNGMSIHHAGMLRNDRKLSEQMFADGAIKVLCCTATLAWGVNLPAHTVVIKGTEVYNAEKGGNVDLGILDVQQIFGRAGRPQFDSFGEAALLTVHKSLSKYINLLVSNVPIESNFIKQLPEHLNAEVVAGTASNIREAVEWLKYTYFYVRMLRNPLIYGITHDEKEDDPLLTERCRGLVKTAAKRLDELRMLRYDEHSGNLAWTELGATASHFYIRTDSVATFNEKLEQMPSPNDGDLCHLVCCASEFDNIKVRQEEMDEIDTLNKSRFLKIDIPVEEYSGKCCVLLQNYISNSKISSFTLISDTNYIAQNAARIARAMFEMALKGGRSSTALKLLRLAKSIDRRMWWSQSPLRQFHGEIPEIVHKKIESKIKIGHDSFLTLLELDYSSNEFGQLCGNKKVGGKIKHLIRLLPAFCVKCSVHPITSSILNFCIELVPDFEWHQRWHGGALGFWFWIEDSEMERVYHHEYILITQRNHSFPVDLEVKVPIFERNLSQYHIRIVSDSWVGCESLTPIFFKDLLLPERETPYTDLLNLTPLPVGALKDSKYKKIYESRFETFNPLQSQLFHILYHSNSNILLGAPTGSGKTLIAELALMRLKLIKPKAKCVYIAPLKSLARERLKEWSSRFGPSSVNWKILELSGDTHHDTRTLNDADVLICTPEKWDLITRGWRGVGLKMLINSPAVSSKLFIKSVGLLVIDEIHLLGEERGAVLESIVSRTRLISRNVLEEERSHKIKTLAGTSSPASEQDVTRIIGLSTALANPMDLADWMGININEGSKAWKGLYNFRPSVRPIPMDVHLQGYPGRHYCPRMATMNKPAYSAIKEHSPNQPALIFVSSRRQTRLTALDLVSFAAADGNPSVFLGCDHDYIESVAETVIDATLKHTLSYGIGIHHAGLGTSDREVVESLFLDGSIQVLVATATLAWGVNLPAHLVIVKGTEFFDKNRFVDYPLTDVLQMIGRAGRPGYSKQGVSVVMVASEKKSFYKRFLYSPFPVESCLKKRMEVVINAEIASSTICSLSDAVGYVSWTYFFRRVKKNPSYYDAPVEAKDDNFQSYFIGNMREALNNLESYSCIVVDREHDDWALKPTVLGCTSSLFYLDFRTPLQMKLSLKDILNSLDESFTSGRSAVQNAGACNDSLLMHRVFMALCFTHEFDEFPVRHNEHEINDRLAVSLDLDVTIKRLLYECFRAGKHDEDSLEVMADPHVKCYLLVIAYISRSPLPISDYVNDTKSLLDQLPRMIAALQFILLNNGSDSKANFHLICMLSKVKQILYSRTIEMDPLLQIPYVSKESADSLRMRGLDFYHLCKTGGPALEKSLKGVIPRATELSKAVSYVQSLAMITIDETTSVVKSADTNEDGNIVGICCIVLSVMTSGGTKNITVNMTDINLSVCLSLTDSGEILAFRSVCLSIRNDRSRTTKFKKEFQLTFDWEKTLAGVDTEGNITVSVIREDIRGLDISQALHISGK